MTALPPSRSPRPGAPLTHEDLGRRSILLLAGTGAAGLFGLQLTGRLAQARGRRPDTDDGGLPAAPPAPAPGTAPDEPWSSGALGDWRSSTHQATSLEQDRMARRGDGVHLVGDSLGTRILAPLRERLGDRPLAHDVWNGRPTAPAVDVLAQLADQDRLAPTVVLVLGSNDIFDPWPFADHVARVVDIARRRRVVWVTPYVSRPGSPAADLRNCAVLGLALERAAAGGHLELVRWFELLARSGPAIADLVEDGVHPSEAGAAALADLVVTTLG